MFRFGFFDLIQAWHDLERRLRRGSELETWHDSSVGLTAARSHRQKQIDKQRLKLHVDRLCAVRVSTVKNKKRGCMHVLMLVFMFAFMFVFVCLHVE